MLASVCTHIWEGLCKDICIYISQMCVGLEVCVYVFHEECVKGNWLKCKNLHVRLSQSGPLGLVVSLLKAVGECFAVDFLFLENYTVEKTRLYFIWVFPTCQGWRKSLWGRSRFPPSSPHLQGLVVLTGWSPSHSRQSDAKRAACPVWTHTKSALPLARGVGERKLQAYHKECFGKWFSFWFVWACISAQSPSPFPLHARLLQILLCCQTGGSEGWLPGAWAWERQWGGLSFIKDFGSGVEQLAGGHSQSLTNENPVHYLLFGELTWPEDTQQLSEEH